MRVLITGSKGQLGRALALTAPTGFDLVLTELPEIDVAWFDDVAAVVMENRPELIVHGAAMTDVDGCERDPERAWQTNALGSQNLAAAAREAGARLVYISTNYVFDGEARQPYHEFAPTNPISVYGASKLAGEQATRALCPNSYIVRTSMVYDETSRNFVTTMLRLAESRPSLDVVADQFGNPTYAVDLAEAIWRLVARPAYGTYHLTNSGVTSWHGWASEVFRLAGLATEARPIPASQFLRAARPPRNGALLNRNAARLGIELPDWRDALARCLARRSELANPR